MWDYIIVGAGSAGCVLANRLTADPQLKVLLIEAGGSDSSLTFRVPALGWLKAVGNPNYDWMFFTEPDPTRHNRTDLWSRGKVIGGSSSVNGTIYVRGNRGDYDHWGQLGNLGWDYDSLVPLFRRLECDSDGLAQSYGKEGPMQIGPSRGVHPLVPVFISAMEELGVPVNSDYNGEVQTGASIAHVTQRRGWRWSAARGYLHPIQSRPNLRVLSRAFARKVVFDGKRAVGVEVEHNGERRIERCAGEVILSASAFNSPKLLMLSGIGDPNHLSELGIEVIHANPNVGRNLQEHPGVAVKGLVNIPTTNMDNNLAGQIRQGLRFALFGAGAATYAFPALAFIKLSPQSQYPDLEVQFGPYAFELGESGVRMFDKPAVTILVNVNRSRSRGQITLRSPRAEDPPIIRPNLLGDRYDIDLLIAGAKFARATLESKAFSPYFQGEHTPGSTVQDDRSWENFVRETAVGSYHPSGTVRMGSDPGAVVDPRLRVVGVSALRVIDSSIIPQIPSGNINAISMVIGEKGADLVLQDRPH